MRDREAMRVFLKIFLQTRDDSAGGILPKLVRVCRPKIIGSSELPALTMSRDLGFRETRRLSGGPDPRYQLIELEMGLPP
jgi:hypothetical protein